MTDLAPDLLVAFEVARSLPLGWLRDLTDGRTRTITGELAQELASALGVEARVFPSASAFGGIAAAPHWFPPSANPIDPGSVLNTDVLVIADLARAAQMRAEPHAVRAAAFALRHYLIFPLKPLSQQEGILVTDWSGFGAAGMDDDTAWRWCIAKDGRAEMTIAASEDRPDNVVLRFILQSPDALQRTVRCNGRALSTGEWSEVSVPLRSDGRTISFEVENPDQAIRLNGVPHHFAVLAPSLNEPAGAVVVDAKALVLTARGEDPHDDVAVRIQLHGAGFPFVGGICRSIHGGEAVAMPWSRGEIFDSTPRRMLDGGAYVSPKTRLGDICWYLCALRARDVVAV